MSHDTGRIFAQEAMSRIMARAMELPAGYAMRVGVATAVIVAVAVLARALGFDQLARPTQALVHAIGRLFA
jgi:hypothetical protein